MINPCIKSPEMDSFTINDLEEQPLIKTYTVIPVQNISFGYKNILKTLWLKDMLPQVTKGIYGGELTKKTVSLEHVLCHMHQGKTTLANLALSTVENNNARGNRPLKYFLDPDKFIEYINQFKGIKLDNFDGDKYAEDLTKTVLTVLREGK